MKGMILTVSVICFGCAIFCAGIFLHADEIQLDSINQAMKRSLQSSMEIMQSKEIDQRTVEEGMKEFLQIFKVLAPKRIHYSAEMLGFSAHPLLMRIKVTAMDFFGKSYVFEETMIEEVIEHEE